MSVEIHFFERVDQMPLPEVQCILIAEVEIVLAEELFKSFVRHPI
jgi:hypothetical protein